MSSHELQRPLPMSFADHTGTMPAMRAGIIGAGNVGMSVALALHARGHLAWIVARSPKRRAECSMAFPSIPVYENGADIETLPDWIIISTPDAAIARAAKECFRADVWSETAAETHDVVMSHCAGALHAEVIADALDDASPACDRRVICAAAHPFQTFPYVSERLVQGVAWGIECHPQDNPAAMQRVAALVRCAGGTPVMLTSEARERKEIYHSVAVVASNYLTAVSGLARQAAHAADIPPVDFLQPIMRTALENSLMSIARDAAPPLTGPIARGDVETVRKHCEAMRSAGETGLLRSYVLMGLVTTDYAARERHIDAATQEALRAYLEGELTRRS